MKWEIYCLNDLYEVHNGLSKGREYFGTGYPFLSFSTVFNNYFIPEEIEGLVQSTEKEQQSYSILRGDIFVTRTSETANELGMSCVALKDYPQATFNGFCKRMRPKTDLVLPEFIGYYMRMPNFRNKFLAFSTMTTRASLRNEDLLGIKISLPSMEKQEKIAKMLLVFDSLIMNNKKQIKLLEEAAQRLYKEWFVDLRFPGHDDVEVVDGLPAGWEVNPINVIAKFHSGYAFKSSDFNKEGIYKIITIKNVLDGSFDGDKTDKIIVIPDKLPKHCVLSDGDILLSLTGNVGRVCLVYGENYLLNQRVAKIESSYPAYIYLLLRSREMFNEMNNLSNGAAQQNLSPIKTSNIKVVIPDEKILELFENLLSPVIKNIIQLNKHNVVLKEARDRLLPKVMNGEVEV